jgi:hypothetical protein
MQFEWCTMELSSEESMDGSFNSSPESLNEYLTKQSFRKGKKISYGQTEIAPFNNSNIKSVPHAQT